MHRALALYSCLTLTACLPSDGGGEGGGGGGGGGENPIFACPSGQVKCDETGLRLAICNDDNQTATLSPCGEGEFCEGGSCQAQICSPDASFCEGRRVERCNANGSASIAGGGADCAVADRWCYQGECVEQPCDGQCWDPMVCDGELASCVERVCVLGQDRCRDDVLERCAESELAWEQVEDCGASGGVCRDGACMILGCGNGRLEEGEACDDGNEENGDSCTNACEFARCGDGFVYQGFEDCDDGNEVATDSCIDCGPAACGDGHLWEGNEECDDGNREEADGCSGDCAVVGISDCEGHANGLQRWAVGREMAGAFVCRNGVGPVAYWALDNNCQDLSDNAHHGTDCELRLGRGLLHDAITEEGDPVRVSSSRDLAVAEGRDVSISMWLRFDSERPNDAGIIGRYQNDNPANSQFLVGLNGRRLWVLSDGTVAAVTYTFPEAVRLRDWHHLVITYQGTFCIPAGCSVAIRLDGEEVHRSFMRLNESVSSRLPLEFAGQGHRQLHGSIDELAFYPFALSSEETDLLRALD